MSGITPGGIRYPDSASRASNLGNELKTLAEDVDRILYTELEDLAEPIVDNLVSAELDEQLQPGTPFYTEIESRLGWLSPTSLTASDNIYDLPPRVYPVGSTAAATALGLPAPGAGFLIVKPRGTAGIIDWEPNRRYNPPETYRTQQLPGTEGWTPWVRISTTPDDPAKLRRFGTIPTSTDLNNLRTMGRHESPQTVADITSLGNLPDGVFRHFVLDVKTVGSVTFQEMTAYLDDDGMGQYERRALGSTWLPWRRTDATNDTPPAPAPSALPTPLAALSILRAHLARVDTEPVPVALAGDSITIGTGATTPADRYTSHVITALQARYPAPGGTESTPQTSTTPSWTTRTAPGVHGYVTGQGGMTAETYLNDDRRAAIAALEPAMIVHAVGYNDYNANVDPVVYKANLESNLDQLDAAMPGHLAVHLLVHQMERPLSTPRTYDWAEYATAMQEIAQERSNVAYVDVEPDFTACDFAGEDPLVLLDTDGIHPSDAGHRLLGETIAAALPRD